MSVAFLDPIYMDIEYLRASHEEWRLQYELFMHPYHEKFQVIVNMSGD